MLKISLTGGVGCGKSTAAKYFTGLKVPVIDADKIAYDLLLPNTATYKKTVAHFGKAFLTAKKTINRKKLRNLIFTNNKERIWLENLLHPAIRKKMHTLVKKSKAPYCILMAPLFFETKFPIKVDRVLVIDCWKKNQIKRIQNRDNSSIKQIQAIMQSQIDRASRLRRANDIINNTSTLAHLKKEVKKLHIYYLSLAEKHGTMHKTILSSYNLIKDDLRTTTE
jgi:dephospho-CoA kinase